MYGKRLLTASPLIAALVFGTVDISQASVVQASVVPKSVSAADSHVTAPLNVAPPRCRRAFNGQLRELCSSGWSEGYTAGKASCGKQNRSFSPAMQDTAYLHGFNGGFAAGKATC
ncbi:hypothetical protein [Streptosporangium sp. 'caverna']|uniref:hypothetical protein n=1 Tax=Streptosporangium sp. 'caverna' TaxID=2202249 RepID=UPI000D7E73DD|nr:hypothetical protein [Streptosporangium sp. 'caverna']AWS42776.1 hypothetical protein DKM19_16795 [Streptosporangium sp. 'caverna']